MLCWLSQSNTRTCDRSHFIMSPILNHSIYLTYICRETKAMTCDKTFYIFKYTFYHASFTRSLVKPGQEKKNQKDKK